MENFKSFITEQKDEPYRLVIISHDDSDDPNETGNLLRTRAESLKLEVLLVEFFGVYTHTEGNKMYINTFPVPKDSPMVLPDGKTTVEYSDPFEIDPKNTLIMIRGLGASIKTGAKSWSDMIENFEYMGFTTINSTACYNMCSDKVMNQIIFERHDFRTPKTVLITHKEDAEDAFKKLDTKFPIILKTGVGSRGIGVILIDSFLALHSTVQLLYRENNFIDLLLQEYIKNDYDIRVIVCNDEILGVMKRPVISGDFRSNVSQGAKPVIYELTELEASESLRAAKAVKGKLVGVDFIPAKNREKDLPYMIEVNSTPGLIGIEEVVKGITDKVLKSFMNRDNWS